MGGALPRLASFAVLADLVGSAGLVKVGPRVAGIERDSPAEILDGLRVEAFLEVPLGLAQEDLGLRTLGWRGDGGLPPPR